MLRFTLVVAAFVSRSVLSRSDYVIQPWASVTVLQRWWRPRRWRLEVRVVVPVPADWDARARVRACRLRSLAL